MPRQFNMALRHAKIAWVATNVMMLLVMLYFWGGGEQSSDMDKFLVRLALMLSFPLGYFGAYIFFFIVAGMLLGIDVEMTVTIEHAMFVLLWMTSVALGYWQWFILIPCWVTESRGNTGNGPSQNRVAGMSRTVRCKLLWGTFALSFIMVAVLFVRVEFVHTTLLHWVVSSGEPAAVRALIAVGMEVDARSREGDTPLHWAAHRNQNPAVIHALLEAGAEVNVHDESGRTPLHAAAHRNQNPAVIHALLEAGAEVNVHDESGRTPLHAAAHRNQNPAVIHVLLEAGAEVNVHSSDRGYTPLHFAVSRSSETTAILLKAGAEVNARLEHDLTPLHLAVLAGDKNIDNIVLLLEAGAESNARAEWGITPLHMAVIHGYPQVITYLIEAGAEVNVRNEEGKTPFDHARENDALKDTDAYRQLQGIQSR